MRLCRVVLLTVVILLAGITKALSTTGQTKTMKSASLDAPHWNRALTTEGNSVPDKRLLRKRDTEDTDTDNEERGLSVTSLAKKLGGKLKRLGMYNWWIFSGKKPADVKDPRYQGYWEFYYNRMVRGGKYA